MQQVSADVTMLPEDEVFQKGRDRMLLKRSCQSRRLPHQCAIGALTSLREVLRSMEVDARRAAIEGFKPHVRVALLAFMEQSGNEVSKRQVARPREVLPIRGSVWTVRRNSMLKFKARVYFGSLCLTTREQTELAMAQRHQAILERVRGAVTIRGAADPEFWEDSDAILHVCRLTMEANYTSEDALGISAFVMLRARQWLGDIRIVSEATTLSSALATRTRLLNARATSWEALRSEWLALLQGAHRKNKPSRQQAEETVDAARCAVLRRQLLRGVYAVERALEGPCGSPVRKRARAVCPPEVCVGRDFFKADAKQCRPANL